MTLLSFMSLTYDLFLLHIPQENKNGRYVTAHKNTSAWQIIDFTQLINSYFFTSNVARLKLHYFRDKIQLAYSVE